MEVRNYFRLSIQEASQVSEARRQAIVLARPFGFSEEMLGKIALIVTECATNLVKHTPQGGEIIVQMVQIGPEYSIEILALDKGHGITNIAEALRDGYSTTGSGGSGLGAIMRLSDTFNIYSNPNEGTAILARLWAVKSPSQVAKAVGTLGTVCVPKTGEQICGDAWAISIEKNRFMICLIDGLGHGVGAAQVSQLGIKTFNANKHRSPVEIINAIHHALQGTRGAVVGIADIDTSTHQLRFAGVGNIDGAIYLPEKTSRFVSHNGTVGYETGRVKEFNYDCPDEAIVVLHSDGCSSQLNLDRYAALKSRDASLIAGILYRDFNRGRDDATVVVVKIPSKDSSIGL